MAYDARVLQILIASPGDVNEEREIMAEVINEWNYLNSRDRSIVLLPLRWETHTFPELGAGPQVSINKQIVDYCDMAVGVFWTRLGTPTSAAESGTAEELARVADAGKPVMLYFSRAKVDLQSVDLTEYARLTAFKDDLYPKALIENYSSPNEFRDTFRRQLAMRIRDTIAEDSLQQDRGGVEIERVVLALAEGSPPRVLTSPSILKLVSVNCIDKDEIPDYGSSDASSQINTGVVTTASTNTALVYGLSNRNYYRELVDYYCGQILRRQLWLAVASSSEQSVRDIHLEIRIRSTNQTISLNPPELPFPASSQSIQTNIFGYLPRDQVSAPGKVSVEATSKNEWRLETDIPIVQARRTVLSSNYFSLAAAESGTATFDATVYSSDAVPFSLSKELDIVVEPHEIRYRDILKQMVPGYSEDIDERAPAESRQD